MSEGSAVDDFVSSVFSTNKQNLHKIVTIPGRVIFDEMLKQLELPTAQYERRLYEDHKICVTVIFQTPNISCDDHLIHMRIAGVRSTDAALAEDTAAVAAIRFMEGAANIVVRDLNYKRLKHVQEENRCLRNQLVDIKIQLKKAGIKGQKFARGWFLSVRNMCSFSAQFHNVAVIANFGGREVISDDMKAAFATVYGAAQQLGSKSARLENKLERVSRS